MNSMIFYCRRVLGVEKKKKSEKFSDLRYVGLKTYNIFGVVIEMRLPAMSILNFG